ncbi:MAG: PASTA domain-containing protein [Candidatus Hydrothermae bacterium]|nr:PASTA domain-containing protein [Candidatus Hydrothermae bacterium]
MTPLVKSWLRALGIYVLALGLLGSVGFGLMDAVVMPAYVHRGDEVFLPQVVGLPLPEALDTLRAHGIPYTVDPVPVPSTSPESTVVRQVPHGNIPIKRGRRVRLVISKGTAVDLLP